MGIIGITGSALAFSSTSGGKVYAYNNISTNPSTVVPGNPSRKKVIFTNPGTVTIFIAPMTAFASPSAVSPTALVPSTSSLGGCYPVFSGGQLVIDGECQLAWQAFAASGTTNSLTVTDTNL